MFHITVVTVDLHTIFQRIICRYVYNTCPTKFQEPSPNSMLVTTVKLNSKENFYMAGMLLFNFLLTKIKYLNKFGSVVHGHWDRQFLILF
jgi:hypothetical protein